MKKIDSILEKIDQYSLLDSGQGRKLESFNGVVLDRPDPQALWNKSHPELWLNSDASFVWEKKLLNVGAEKNAGGKWKKKKGLAEDWTIAQHGIKGELSFRGFKHVGIFPEHANQWDELIELGKKNPESTMLNLFGYTGFASIAGALGGLKVTHIDASKTTIDILKNNIKKSGLKNDSIRIICEDSTRFVKRLIKREEVFDIILLDPPAFGRGPKGEVWKIEENLAELISLIPQILSKKPKMVILNGYASGYSARTFAELLTTIQDRFGGEIVYGDVGIKQKDSERILTTGIYAKWQN